MKYASAGVRPSVSNRGRGGEGGAAAGRVCAQHEACGRTQPRRGRCMGTLATAVHQCVHMHTAAPPHDSRKPGALCSAPVNCGQRVVFSGISRPRNRRAGGGAGALAYWNHAPGVGRSALCSGPVAGCRCAQAQAVTIEAKRGGATASCQLAEHPGAQHATCAARALLCLQLPGRRPLRPGAFVYGPHSLTSSN